MIVAITGYIGSGKSTAASVFQENGFLIIDADKIGHSLLDEEEIIHKLAYEFGKDILTHQVTINRDVLGELVFNDPEKLKELNRILHPKIWNMIKEKIKKHSDRDIVIDAALFEELNLNGIAEKVIRIDANVQSIFERVKSYSQKQILNIMNSQSLVKKPDFEIDNNSSIEDFKKKIEMLISKLKKTSII